MRPCVPTCCVPACLPACHVRSNEEKEKRKKARKAGGRTYVASRKVEQSLLLVYSSTRRVEGGVGIQGGTVSGFTLSGWLPAWVCYCSLLLMLATIPFVPLPSFAVLDKTPD